jgi:hypothetical protein
MIAMPRARRRHRPACRCLDPTPHRVITPQPGLNATRNLTDASAAIHADARIVYMANSPGQLRLALDLDHRPGRSRQGHGSRACYLAGCREPVCIRANASYQRDYRNKLRGTNARRLGGYRLDDTS